MRVRGFLFSLTTACMFGLGAVLAKLLGETFQPFFVSWLALLGGGLCVSACQILRRKPLLPRMTRASWGDLFLFASIGTALPLVCVIAGLSQTGAITGSFLLQLQAPAALLFALRSAGADCSRGDRLLLHPWQTSHRARGCFAD